MERDSAFGHGTKREATHLTVRELIEALSRFPEKYKDLPVCVIDLSGQDMAKEGDVFADDPLCAEAYALAERFSEETGEVGAIAIGCNMADAARIRVMSRIMSQKEGN
jgi:hypothetical protein